MGQKTSFLNNDSSQLVNRSNSINVKLDLINPPQLNLSPDPSVHSDSNDSIELENENQKNAELQKDKKKKKRQVNLENSLDISLKSLKSYMQISQTQSQALPCVLSVNTKNIENEDDSIGIDLVLVIDNSGSMSGEKSSLVREALKFLIDFMKPKDRICLISFEDNATEITPLMRCDENGKSIVKPKIKYFCGNGSTNVMSGLELAANVLLSKETESEYTSIFLLTDGIDSFSLNGPLDERVKKMLEEKNLGKENSKISYNINTFGFGDDHEPDMMRNIAQYKDGSFYYINKLKEVKTCFMDALGGLDSIICKNVKIRTRTVSKAPWSDLRVSKTYGAEWSFDEETREYTISLGHLIYGVSRDFVFILNFPPIKNVFSREEKRKVILNAEFSCDPVGSQQGENRVIKSLELSLYFFNWNEKSHFLDVNNTDWEVMVQLLRVKTADALGLAINLSEKGDYTQSSNILKEQLAFIAKYQPIQNDPRVKYLVSDLKNALENCKPVEFSRNGRNLMYNLDFCHRNQQSSQNSSEYCNVRQRVYQRLV